MSLLLFISLDHGLTRRIFDSIIGPSIDVETGDLIDNPSILRTGFCMIVGGLGIALRYRKEKS